MKSPLEIAVPANPRQPCEKLNFILDLVVSGALQKTGAGGAAVALIQGDVLICRARAGEIAPDLNMMQNTSSGFTGACVRERRTLICEDVATDPRINAAVCYRLGIHSILAVPILQSETVFGVIELLSLKERAFDAEDVRWLERLADLIRELSAEIVPVEVANGEHQIAAPPNADQGEAELADILRQLQEGLPTATWDEIRHRVLSRR